MPLAHLPRRGGRCLPPLPPREKAGARGARTATPFLLGLLVLLSAVACGRKGDPMPPGLRVPSPPSKVTLSGPAGVLTVSWSAPREDMGGRVLREEELRYRILRAAWAPGADACESCPEDLRVAAEVDPLAREARGEPGRVWSDPDTRPGWTYRYRVLSLDARGRSGPPSEAAQLTWVGLEPPRAQVSAGDGQARVTVEPLAWPQGVEPLGLRVYGDDGRPWLSAEPGPRGVSIFGLPNGEAWRGSVRWSARVPEGWEVEGPATAVAVTPLDTTPPLPPSEVLALVAEEGVRLRWQPEGPEPYATVRVLRAEGAGEFEERARLPGDAVEYRDVAARPGPEYRYRLVALDQAGNESLPAREASIRLR